MGLATFFPKYPDSINSYLVETTWSSGPRQKFPVSWRCYWWVSADGLRKATTAVSALNLVQIMQFQICNPPHCRLQKHHLWGWVWLQGGVFVVRNTSSTSILFGRPDASGAKAAGALLEELVYLFDEFIRWHIHDANWVSYGQPTFPVIYQFSYLFLTCREGCLFLPALSNSRRGSQFFISAAKEGYWGYLIDWFALDCFSLMFSSLFADFRHIAWGVGLAPLRGRELLRKVIISKDVFHVTILCPMCLHMCCEYWHKLHGINLLNHEW